MKTRVSALIASLVTICACNDSPTGQGSSTAARSASSATPASASAAAPADLTKDVEATCKKFDALDPREPEKKKKSMDACLQDVGDAAKVSAKAFECIKACSAKTEEKEAISCWVDCEMNDPAVQKMKVEKEKARIASWPKQKDKTFSETMTFALNQPAATVSITLGELFEKDGAGDTAGWSYAMNDDGKSDDPPGISIGYAMPSLEETAKSLGMGDAGGATILRQDKAEDGGYSGRIELGNGGIAVARAIKFQKELIGCRATIDRPDAKASGDVLFPWLEKMCGSMTATELKASE